MNEDKPKRTYKDSGFRNKFSNPADLSAIHTRITGIPTNPDDITINTLGHVFFSLERNDLSYLEYKPLRDYSFFVYDVRRRIEAGEVLKEAIQNSIEYCIKHDIMKKYLIENQKEVLDMYSLHWSEQAAREDGRIEGRHEERSSAIRTLITTLKDLSISQPQVVEQLMKRYSLTRQDALAAVQANW